MPTPVETILETIGIPADDITKISALTEDEVKTFDAKPYAEKVKSNYQTQFKNDPSFFTDIKLENLAPDVRKQIESGQYARATNVAKEKIAKALGFSADEIKDLEADDYKALDFYVPAITEKWTKTKSSDKEVQSQLIAERKKNEELQTKFGADYEKNIETKYQTQAEQKVTAAIFNASLIGELSTIPGLKIAAADIAKTANDILQSKYSFQRVGDYSVELRQKANPEMKVLKTGSSQELTLKEALHDIATERGWVEKEKEGGSGGGTVKIEPGKDGVLHMVAPHVQDKISKKIAAQT